MTPTRTASQTVGPYYTLGLCRRSENELADREDAGAFQLVGELIDGEGTPINDGLIEIWDAAGGRWGRSTTDADGRFTFVVTKPEGLPGQAPRFDLFVFARGLLRHQLTRVYFPDEAEANAGDPVFAALDEDDRETLLAEQEDGALRFDVHMQGERATVFFEH
jgi:protocatechuate 3,4-dioxygenase alpha subunit